MPCSQTTPVGQAYFCTRFPHVSVWLSFSFNLSGVPLTSPVAPFKVFSLTAWNALHFKAHRETRDRDGIPPPAWKERPGPRTELSAACSACDLATHLTSDPPASAFLSKMQVNPPQVVLRSQGIICEAPHTASSLWCEPS